MKLDRMAFAKVVAHCITNGMSAGDYEIEELDARINIEVPTQPVNTAKCSDVDDLLKAMALGEKIPAIKAYRVLTGVGLKESKDAVEKYWMSKGNYVPPQPMHPNESASGATLSDILGHATGRNKAGNDISGI